MNSRRESASRAPARRAAALLIGCALLFAGSPPIRSACAQATPAPARGRAASPRATPADSRAWTERPLKVPVVGHAMAYVPTAQPAGVVLFISGDGGWNKGVVDMARRIAPRAPVIGISYPALRKAAGKSSSCWYPAGDLEIISRSAQKQLHLSQYLPPILIGYSSGATLVFAALASAPPTTFAGGISLGFCPDLPADRPVCSAGAWRPTFTAKTREAWLPHIDALPHDWYVLNGIADQVCDTKTMRGFVSDIARGHIDVLDGTGHGFGKPALWTASFDRAVDALLTNAKPRPSVPSPAPAASHDLESALEQLHLPLDDSWADQPIAFLVFVSGDGGWAAIDEGIAATLVSQRVSVIGLSSLKYFWREKTVEQVASALSAMVASLRTAGRPIFVGGYSFGASVVPLAVQASPELVHEVRGLVLISPSSSASFEIDPLDWIRNGAENPASRVAPAVRASKLPALCVAGTEEEDGACLDLAARAPIEVLRLPGSHHFKGDYTVVGESIARFIQATISAPR